MQSNQITEEKIEEKSGESNESKSSGQDLKNTELEFIKKLNLFIEQYMKNMKKSFREDNLFKILNLNEEARENKERTIKILKTESQRFLRAIHNQFKVTGHLIDRKRWTTY